MNNTQSAVKEELESVKLEVNGILPKLGKHKIEELQRVISKHYIKRFRGKRKTPKYGSLNRGFTDEQLQAFFYAVDKEKYRLLFSYMAYLGLRIGEVVKVNIRDIDFQTRELRVKSEKTNRLDLLIIPLGLFQQTQAFMDGNRLVIDSSQGYLFFKDVDRKQREELWLEPNYVRKIFRDYLIDAGLDEVYDISEESDGRSVRKLHTLTTHSFRHYAITKFAKASNGNLILTSRFARHSEPSTTTTYIHTERKELYEQIEKAFDT